MRSDRAPVETAPVSQTAAVITVAYAIACAIGTAIAIVVWQSTRATEPGQDDLRSWSHRETTWLVIVLAGLFALLLATIFYVPYGETAGTRRQIVRVTGVQFAWAIDPAEVRTEIPVEFQLSSRDVSHGFGIYDPGGALVTQAQVLPGETQTLVWTFDEPGRYEILCLEFCGASHHRMISTLEVRR
jgi:cytochrome c oxidase subunit 2